MKIAIITSRYPKENQPYNHMFVHVRALYFQSQGVDVTILVPSKKHFVYNYQGIEVVETNASTIVSMLSQYDLLYLHLLNQYPLINGGFSIYNAIIKYKYRVVIYMHGSDVLTYPKYFFDFKWNVKTLIKVAYTNIWKRYFINRFVKYVYKSKGLVMAPSVWMAKQIEHLYKIPNYDITVVANGIDTDHFCSSGGFDKRYKMLCIRPFNSVYPLEETIRFMTFLPQEFSLDIYGKGDKFLELKKLIDELGLNERVNIYNKFFKRTELPHLFKEYGVFIAFSKIDTQGVSMCEGLASGMLVLSTDIAAIPEFIVNRVNGLLIQGQNYTCFAKEVVEVCSDYYKFNNITLKARESMKNIEWRIQGQKELSLLKKVINEII